MDPEENTGKDFDDKVQDLYGGKSDEEENGESE